MYIYSRGKTFTFLPFHLRVLFWKYWPDAAALNAANWRSCQSVGRWCCCCSAEENGRKDLEIDAAKRINSLIKRHQVSSNSNNDVVTVNLLIKCSFMLSLIRQRFCELTLKFILPDGRRSVLWWSKFIMRSFNINDTNMSTGVALCAY